MRSGISAVASRGSGRAFLCMHRSFFQVVRRRGRQGGAYIGHPETETPASRSITFPAPKPGLAAPLACTLAEKMTAWHKDQAVIESKTIYIEIVIVRVFGFVQLSTPLLLHIAYQCGAVVTFTQRKRQDHALRQITWVSVEL